MNERDIELAKSVDPIAWVALHQDDMDWVQQFADLIRADEREACAKLADAASVYNRFISIEIASAIRARRET